MACLACGVKMSGLLMRWCNDALQLSATVQNFERDFCNGYLFGEVLAKFNQQPDFTQFVNADTSNAKINNYCRLEPTLRRMRIKFDSKVAFALMNGDRGVASKLLYQVKMGIEALGGTTVGRTQAGAVAALAHTTSRMSKPVYDKTVHNHFEKSIRALAANQNQVDMARHLKKFTDEGRRQAEGAARATDSILWDAQNQKRETRRQRIHATRREHDVMHDAQEQGVREWERNQEIRLAQQYMQRTFKQRQADMRSTKRMLQTMDARAEVESGIAEFEARAAAEFGVTTAGDEAPQTVMPDTREYDQYVEDLENLVPDEATMREESAAFMATVAARNAERRLVNAAREKRKRQFVVSMERLQHAQLADMRNSVLQKMLQRPTAAEAELDARLGTVDKYRRVFVDNRTFRETQYSAARRAESQLVLSRDDKNYEIAV